MLSSCSVVVGTITTGRKSRVGGGHAVTFRRPSPVLVVVAAGLELTTRTPSQRVMLAAILLVALIIGIATFRRFGMRRGPLPQRFPQKSQRVTSAAFVAPVLGLMIGYAGRFAVVPDSGDRSSFWAGSAGSGGRFCTCHSFGASSHPGVTSPGSSC